MFFVSGRIFLNFALAPELNIGYLARIKNGSTVCIYNSGLHEKDKNSVGKGN